MRKEYIWTEEHIKEYVKENLSEFSAKVEKAMAEIKEMPRPLFREFKQALVKSAGAPEDKISKASDIGIRYAATLYTLLEMIGSLGKEDSDPKILVEDPAEITGALPMAILMSVDQGDADSPSFTLHSKQPPIELRILNADEIVSEVRYRLSEYDRHFSEIFTMAKDAKAFSKFANSLRPRLAIPNKKDAVELARYASRAAAILVITSGDDKLHKTCVESLDDLDKAGAALNRISFSGYKTKNDAEAERVARGALDAVRKHEHLSKMS